MKRTLVFLLFALLAAPVFAAARSPVPRDKSLRKEGVRVFLPDVGQLWEMTVSAIAKAQGSMDPNGKPPAPPGTGSTSDAQGSMDPNG